MILSDSRILITGGCGFLGSHLVEEAVRLGATVTVVNRPIAGKTPYTFHDTVKVVWADLRDPVFETTLCDGHYDVVFHFAGSASVSRSVADPYEDFDNNLGSAMRLLELLRLRCSGTALLIASSAAVYGDPDHLPMRETDPTRPISPYGATKLAIEHYAAVYNRLYGIPTASLRFFSVYGPRQRQLVVYDLIARLHDNPDTLTLLGDGTETRDLIHARDGARAAIAVFERGKLRGEVYNVASGQPVAIRDIARTIAQAMGVDPSISVTGQGRAGDPIHWGADIDRIRQLGFIPEIDLEQGIADTVSWFRSTR
ncbi:MAG: NAD-dependent epimerase/dehydratase family protein [candidate division Zixibacteria bacterium]|nr:NAD-dependent epimerase/dehydratase family protein [candidate division Zixibacteria bacterium]